MILKYANPDGQIHEMPVNKPEEQDWLSFIEECKATVIGCTMASLIFDFKDCLKLYEILKQFVPQGNLQIFFSRLLYGSGIDNCSWNRGERREDTKFIITLK